MNLTDERIKSALKDAQTKDKLDIVSMVTGIEEHRLLEIIDSNVSMTQLEKSILAMHIG